MTNHDSQSQTATLGTQREENYRASRALATPERLRLLFAPTNIAMVGASDNSGWAAQIVGSSAAMGFQGKLIPVHPKATTAFGLPVARSVQEIGEPVDLAFILAPVHAVESVLDDLGAAGVHNALVLAAGYRETGGEGRVLEDSMIARAIANDISVLGPNALGFVNAHAHAAPYGLGAHPGTLAGPVGIALQSGGLVSHVMDFARAQAIGISTIVSVGNESMVDAADIVDYFVEDDATKVICLFLETISNPSRFASVAAKADTAGKPIVVLKVGATPVGQQSALAHTGSVAGDDAVVDAVLRQLNVIRVKSLEELLATAAILGYNKWPRGPRLGVLTASGGTCDIIADTATPYGLEIPDFASETAAAIAEHLPAFASARNPLDVTPSGALDNAGVPGSLSALEHALVAAVDDPNLDVILYAGVLLPDMRPANEAVSSMIEGSLSWLADQIEASPIPIIPLGPTCSNLSEYGRSLIASHGMNVLPGMNIGISALASAITWVENRGKVRVENSALVALRETRILGTWSEEQGRALLTEVGVPIAPGGLARTVSEAVSLATSIGFPVAMKVCSAQIAHKSDIGGVKLGLISEHEVREAFEDVTAAGNAVLGAKVDGALIAPMRTGGTELLVGVTVDPTFGPVIAVGLGGVWVEIMKDSALRLLPVNHDDAKGMLRELKGFPLLQGARGTRPADLDAIADAIVRLGDAALSLGDSLEVLEVNPLWVNGDQVEALDVLIATQPGNWSGRTYDTQP